MAGTMIEPINVQKFAKYVGSSDTQIYHLINAGVIKVIEKGQRMLINPVTNRPRYFHYKSLATKNPTTKIDGVMLTEIDRLCSSGAEYSRTTPKESEEALDKVNGDDQNGIPETAVEKQISELAQSRLRKEQALAKRAELDCAEREGRLIPRDAVVNLWRDIGIKVQQAILAIPDRVSPVMAGENDAHKIHKSLTEELKHALRNLSFDLKKIKEAD